MRIISQTPDELVLEERNYAKFIVGIPFLAFGGFGLLISEYVQVPFWVATAAPFPKVTKDAELGRVVETILPAA